MNTDVLIRGSRRTVLVVDDEPVNRELLGFILEARYDVLYAGNGLEAFEVLRSHPGRVSMIMLDIKMPVMNGIEFLRAADEDESINQIPVIVLTSDKDAELESLRLGAMDFIMKPFEMPEIILARVRRIIEFVEDRQIIRDVERDGLTNLYTRSFFLEYCRRFIETSDGARRDMLAIDIDRFRLVNEVYGKGFGDEALCAVAEGIRSALNGRFGISCRADADQFYVLTDRAEDYRDFFNAVSARVQAWNRTAAGVKLRMGVCRDVDASRNVEWYAEAARSACGTVRGAYHRSVAYYDDQLHRQELLNERLIADVDEAIRQRQFRMYYQPKYDVRGDVPKLYGAEALVRWQHPELGLISPGTFIPLFEQNGLILKLDDFIWRETAAQIADWARRYNRRLPVSVNLSRMDFFDANLKQRLLDIVRESGVDRRGIVLEITESACSDDVEQMLRTLSELREAGFRIEMDDFGSGYSSLAMLCEMPIDAMKIDMKFVRNLVDTASGYRMMELVIEMARTLGVPALVEGVENEAQYRLMKRAGCDIIQGYYFSRPLDAESFEALLKNTEEGD